LTFVGGGAPAQEAVDKPRVEIPGPKVLIQDDIAEELQRGFDAVNSIFR
jgi:hypothetical protein